MVFDLWSQPRRRGLPAIAMALALGAVVPGLHADPVHRHAPEGARKAAFEVTVPAWPAAPVRTGAQPVGLSLVDVDRDGRQELLVADGAAPCLEGVREASGFAFDPVEPLVVWVTTARGVHWSGDGGANWVRLKGQPSTNVGEWAGPYCQRPLAIAVGRPQRLYVGVGSTLYRATLAQGSTAIVDARGGNAVPGLHAVKLYPNPTNGAAVLEYQTDGTALVVVEVYDLLGQRVWRDLQAAGPAGVRRVAWPGTAADGQTAANGVYVARVHSAGRTFVARIAMVH